MVVDGGVQYVTYQQVESTPSMSDTPMFLGRVELVEQVPYLHVVQ
jgi:hypothetical protein